MQLFTPFIQGTRYKMLKTQSGNPAF